MKYTIEDPEAQNNTIIEADNPREALETYVFNECHDAGDGDEVNVTIVDPDGNRWEGTAEVEEVRRVDTYVYPIKDGEPTAQSLRQKAKFRLKK